MKPQQLANLKELACGMTDEKYNEIVYSTTVTEKTRSCNMVDEKNNEVVYIIENWDNSEIWQEHQIGYSHEKSIQ